MERLARFKWSCLLGLVIADEECFFLINVDDRIAWTFTKRRWLTRRNACLRTSRKIAAAKLGSSSRRFSTGSSVRPSTSAAIRCRRRRTSLLTRCQCYKTFFSSLPMTRPNKLEGLSLETLFQSALRIWGQGQSQPNWSTFPMLPSWVSSLWYQQMID